MNNKCCSVDQRINGQRTYQQKTEVVPSSGFSSCTQGLWLFGTTSRVADVFAITRVNDGGRPDGCIVIAAVRETVTKFGEGRGGCLVPELQDKHG